VFGPLNGITTRDPAFGMEAVWIEPALRDQAQTLGYTVVDASTVVATHLSQLLQQQAHELLGHDETQQLMNSLAKSAPKLVEDLIPKILSLASITKVLQGLLAERVPIRNLRSIVETMAEQAPKSSDSATLLAQVRVALGRQIVQSIAGLTDELPVVTLDADLEQLLVSSAANAAATPGLEPGLAERLQSRLQQVVSGQDSLGEPSVLLVPPVLRPALTRFARASLPQLHVLAWNEIPDSRKVRLIATVGKT
jgi:flagellar biosynthesis protein FlhA